MLVAFSEVRYTREMRAPSTLATLAIGAAFCLPSKSSAELAPVDLIMAESLDQSRVHFSRTSEGEIVGLCGVFPVNATALDAESLRHAAATFINSHRALFGLSAGYDAFQQLDFGQPAFTSNPETPRPGGERHIFLRAEQLVAGLQVRDRPINFIFRDDGSLVRVRGRFVDKPAPLENPAFTAEQALGVALPYLRRYPLESLRIVDAPNTGPRRPTFRVKTAGEDYYIQRTFDVKSDAMVWLVSDTRTSVFVDEVGGTATRFARAHSSTPDTGNLLRLNYTANNHVVRNSKGTASSIIDKAASGGTCTWTLKYDGTRGIDRIQDAIYSQASVVNNCTTPTFNFNNGHNQGDGRNFQAHIYFWAERARGFYSAFTWPSVGTPVDVDLDIQVFADSCGAEACYVSDFTKIWLN